MMSGINVNNIKVDIDYAEYLGKDWVKSYKNPGTIITNH